MTVFLFKNVVDFIPNFDETEKEPSVLPVRIPNLLVNGAEGIAVGMATSIPPHNLAEVVEAEKAYMKNNDITTKELMKYLKGPDFPTGGIVTNEDELMEIYETGVGKIKVRGKVEEEKGKNGKNRIVITEIPYTMIGANIAKFLNDVVGLIDAKLTNDIVDISNQSSKEGIRIVIELRKDADSENFKNLLYKKTRLEDTFGVNMLAVANGRPETMGLRDILEYHVDFLFDVTTRKYTTLLQKEKDRQEIQEGLIKACDCIDLIIEILRGSKDLKEAKECLINGNTGKIKFKSASSKKDAALLHFTERQATAILEMRLYKLIGLEIDALRKEHDTTLKNIALYNDILNNYDSMASVIMKELDEYKKEYGRPRRTQIENAEEVVLKEKEIEEIDVYFLMDRFGYAKAIDEATYERNKDAADAENRYIIKCKNLGRVCIFTDKGSVHNIKVMDLPFGRFRDKGIPIDNISNYDSTKENIVFVEDMARVARSKLMFTTKQAMMKQVYGTEFDVAKRTVAATKLQEDDEVLHIENIIDQRNVVLKTKDGFFLRFNVEEVPEKKKSAVGVRGMKLTKNDSVEEVFFTRNGDEQSFEYKGKNIELNKIKLMKRDSKGVKVRV